ncbi:kell blood group glycoprotein isoform X2 [Betta splendens]|uniref:Kell blood group glycoprotein isoform X2 n=1 Tax=Betta splendens TaxID=158456 RepID=A0A6P7KT99_BETSP|nr:kell blood group glycoprotein isoform X2 [Betta splendens]
MSPMELESDPSTQPTSETASEPPPLVLNPDPSGTQQHPHLQSEIQMSEAGLADNGVEHRHRAKPAWMNRWRLFLFILGLLFLCAAVLGLIYYRHQRNNQRNSQATPCLSPACLRASARLVASGDPSTQPCSYFSSRCGSGRLSPDRGGGQGARGLPGHPQVQSEKAALPERTGTGHEGGGGGLTERKLLHRKTVLLQYLREILESKDRLNGSAAEKAKAFYNSCLDTASVETAGVEPFLALIQKVGGWAVSGQWKQADFNSTLILLMRDYNTFPFFKLYMGTDPRDTANGTLKRYIQIDQPNLLIPIEWNSRTNKSQVKAQTLRPFLALCQRYLSFLGATAGSSMIHAGTFMSLSSELAVSAAPPRYRRARGQLSQRVSIRELQSRAPAVDWLRCLQAVFHPLRVAADDLVLVHNLPYIAHMSPIIGKWLNKHELSSSGPLQTYMVLNLLHTLIPALDARFYDTARNLSVALGNADKAAPRWKYCVLETGRGLDPVLTHLLGERVAHREAGELILYIFYSLTAKLRERQWTHQRTLQSVMEKIESLVPRLWIPKELHSEAELDLLFAKVSLNGSFFSNYVQLLSLWQSRRSKPLMEQTEKTDILSVSPFVLDNKLLIPMGMFPPPFFHPTYPRAMNYGGIGFLIAKDILHLLLPRIYSQSESVRAEGECVWANFLNLTEKDSRAGASQWKAQQEAWVQYSALQIALQAYHQSLKQHPADTSISGLSYTRLFFSSFSQISCDSDPEFMPLEPSFLITAVCSKFNMCPSSLQCLSKAQQRLLQNC